MKKYFEFTDHARVCIATLVRAGMWIRATQQMSNQNDTEKKTHNNRTRFTNVLCTMYIINIPLGRMIAIISLRIVDDDLDMILFFPAWPPNYKPNFQESWDSSALWKRENSLEANALWTISKDRVLLIWISTEHCQENTNKSTKQRKLPLSKMMFIGL